MAIAWKDSLVEGQKQAGQNHRPVLLDISAAPR